MSTKVERSLASKVGSVLPVIVTGILGAIGAAVGFTHTHDWAEHNGQHGWVAWADAIVIEGMVLVAGFEIHRSRHQPRSPGDPPRSIRFPMAVLVVGFLVQMWAQIAEAQQTPAGWLVAAMPALCFLTVVKLLMRRIPDEAASDDTEQVAPTVPTVTTVPPPSHVVAIPRLRLPHQLAERVAAAVAQAQREGRTPSAEDIERSAGLPRDMAERVIADLAGTNGHRQT